MTRTIPSERYWDYNCFKSSDALNAEIWDESPRLQREIQSPAELAGEGSVGPQQAMLEPGGNILADTVLPWVPDLVGKEADGLRAVLIYGVAYAGFIKEYSGRKASLPLIDYLQAMYHGDVAGFQREYIGKVVVPDKAYYGQLARLLRAVGVPASCVILSDLCLNSLVMRGGGNGRKRMDCSLQPGRERAAAFCRYVENPTAAGWTWRRIVESGADRIVALGHIAEHGLLRLFQSRGAEIAPAFRGDVSSPGWVDRYADSSKKLEHWLKERGNWWTISILGRTIRLLPVYHPASMSARDPGYEATTRALDDFLSGRGE